MIKTKGAGIHSFRKTAGSLQLSYNHSTMLVIHAKHDAGEVSKECLQRAGGRCKPVTNRADSAPKVAGESRVGALR